MNGFIKDGAHEAVDDPERVRIRGVAPQSVLVAFQLCAANLRKVDSLRAQLEAEKNGSLRRLPRRRATRAINDWINDSAVPATTGQTVPGPEPPLIA
jgi:hypothetical protein